MFIAVVEQRGLRRKQHPADASKRLYGLAFVVLCAEALTEEERPGLALAPQSCRAQVAA